MITRPDTEVSNLLAEAVAIFVMLAVLSILIIVHEFGHFSVARIFGFQTPVFGFGLPFGPYAVVGHKWGTEFRVYACVLGGFVAIPELGDETNAREETYGVPLRPFRKFPIWQRALVAFAGVGFNILFAWLIMLIMLITLGEPTYSTIVENLPPANPIAAQAGVMVGDKILSIDDYKVTSPEDIVQYLGHRPNTAVIVHIERKSASQAPDKSAPPKSDNASTDSGGKTDVPSRLVDIHVTTNQDGKVGMALIAKGPVRYTPARGNFIELAGDAAERLWKLTVSMLDALGQMMQGIFHMSKPAAGHPTLGAGDLHGVLAVVAIGAEIFQQDWTQIFLFTIMISLDLAIINLVPWPALDGGHLAFMAFEAVRGKPMHERAQGEIVKWGFISLLLLMALIMFNDVNALLTGKLELKLKNKDKDGSRESQPADKPALPQDKSSGPTDKSTGTPVSSGQPANKSAQPTGDSPTTNSGGKTEVPSSSTSQP